MGDTLHSLEIHIGGLSLLTVAGIRLNIFSRFRIGGFDGRNPMSMIGERIEAVKEDRDCITIEVGKAVVEIGLRDDDRTGPEIWLMKLPDGTLVVENGN